MLLNYPNLKPNILFSLLDTNVPAVLKVQASELGLKIQKYPQESQNTAKKHPSTLVLQEYLVSDKSGF